MGLIVAWIGFGAEVGIDSCTGRCRNAHEILDCWTLRFSVLVSFQESFDVVLRHGNFVEGGDDIRLCAVDFQWDAEEAEDRLLGSLLSWVDTCSVHLVDIRCLERRGWTGNWGGRRRWSWPWSGRLSVLI